jgi:hypothetical protein
MGRFKRFVADLTAAEQLLISTIAAVALVVAVAEPHSLRLTQDSELAGPAQR